MNSRKELVLQAKRRALLEAALELFKKKGIEDTSLEEIARAADYTRASLYNYFKSRDDICLQILVEFSEAYKRQLEAMEKVATPLDKLHDWGEARYLYSKEHPYFVEIMAYLDFRGVRPERISEEFYKAYDKLNIESLNILREVFRQGIEDGSIDPDLDIDTTINQYSYTLRRIIDRAIKGTYSFMDIIPDDYFYHYLRFYMKSLRAPERNQP